MADKKISELTSASLPLAGTEEIPIVQSGVTKKVAVSEFGGGDISGKEDTSNKKTDLEANKTSNTFYASCKAIVDWVYNFFIPLAGITVSGRKMKFDFLSTGLKISSRSDGSETGVVLNTDSLTVDRTRAERNSNGRYVIETATGNQDGYNQVNGCSTNAINGTSPNANVISGGGITGSENIITNGNFRTIGGGYDNKITSTGIGADTIGGGAHHLINGTSTHGTIGGGSYNTIASGDYSTITGGSSNTINGSGIVINGGTNNAVSADSSVIGGGTDNNVSGQTAGIASGNANIVSSNSAFIGGGSTNKIQNSTGANINGGVQNEIYPTTASWGNYSTVGGGFQNKISATLQATYAVIGGGRGNLNNSIYSTIVGGRENETRGQYSLIAGYGGTVYTYGEVVFGLFPTLITGSASTIVGTEPAFRIGNGTGTGARSDAFKVLKNGTLVMQNVVKLKSYTVSTLPTGNEGDVAYVTDALSPTYLGVAIGGGSVKCKVFFNGTNWIT